MKVALIAASLVSVLTTICIVGSLLFETLSFFGEVPVNDFLFGTKWSPTFAGEQASFGVLPLLWGTLYMSLIALARRDPARPAVRDLSLRVRASRACARRSSRCSSCSPASRRSSSATSR